MRILKHALESFASRGYAGTNVRAIAESAELTAPMINYYFETKEKLYRRLAELVLGTLEERVILALKSATTFREQLLRVLSAHLAYASDSPAALGFIVDLTYGAANGRPAVDVQALYARTRSRIGEVFSTAIARGEFRPRPGISSAEAQRGFEAALNGLVLGAFEARKQGQSLPTEATVTRSVELLFDGLGKVAQGSGRPKRTSSGRHVAPKRRR